MVEIRDSGVLDIPAHKEDFAGVQEGRRQHLERVVGLDQAGRGSLDDKMNHKFLVTDYKILPFPGHQRTYLCSL